MTEDVDRPRVPDNAEPIENLPKDERTTRRQALNQVRGEARPVGRTPSGDEDLGKDKPPEAGGRFLTALLFRSFFYDYFVRMAHRKYVGSSASRVRRAASEHPRLHRFVIFMDMLLLTVVTFALIAIAIAGAWKTLSPLPALW